MRANIFWATWDRDVLSYRNEEVNYRRNRDSAVITPPAGGTLALPSRNVFVCFPLSLTLSLSDALLSSPYTTSRSTLSFQAVSAYLRCQRMVNDIPNGSN